MARPVKQNLDYFPLDCNLDQKFQLLEAEHGITGFGIIIRLLQTIYGEEGYYIKWDRDTEILFASKIILDGDINIKINKIRAVIKKGYILTGNVREIQHFNIKRNPGKV